MATRLTPDSQSLLLLGGAAALLVIAMTNKAPAAAAWATPWSSAADRALALARGPLQQPCLTCRRTTISSPEEAYMGLNGMITG